MKGRPTIFNNNDLVNQAQKIFWKKGYTATSLSELIKVTGAGSGSFYNAFKGGKREIFSKSLQQRRQALMDFRQRLQASSAPLELIKSFFRSIAREQVDLHEQGCIVANTIVEMSNLDENLKNEAVEILKEVELMFTDAIQQAQNEGTIGNTTKASILGRYLVTFWCGLNTLRRMYPDSQTLLRQIDMQLQLID